jgi:hypothetical protein
MAVAHRQVADRLAVEHLIDLLFPGFGHPVNSSSMLDRKVSP